VLIMLAILYNCFMALAWGLSWDAIWYWNVLQCIAFSRLFATLIMKFSRKIRFVIAIGIIVLTPVLLLWMEPRYKVEVGAAIVYYIFFHPFNATVSICFGFLFYVPFFIIGSLLGESTRDIETMQAKEQQKGKLTPVSLKVLRLWVCIGVALFATGILSGLNLSSHEYLPLIPGMNTFPGLHITALPQFLITNSYAWCLYCVGFEIMLSLVLLYFIDLNGKSKRYWPLAYYGRYSLTIYILYYFFLLLPPCSFFAGSLDWATVWIAEILFFIGNWVLVYALDRKWQGKASLEYQLELLGGLLYEKLQGRSKASPAKQELMRETLVTLEKEAEESLIQGKSTNYLDKLLEMHTLALKLNEKEKAAQIKARFEAFKANR